MTSGSGVMVHSFEHYAPLKKIARARRANGALVSMATGKSLGFALFNLQERGQLFIGPGEEVYEGQVVGMSSRDRDLAVNPLKGKKLTNMRASGKDDAIVLTRPTRLTLEQALEFIEDDELVEVTPAALRIRKRNLKEKGRRRDAKATNAAAAAAAV